MRKDNELLAKAIHNELYGRLSAFIKNLVATSVLLGITSLTFLFYWNCYLCNFN